MSAKIPKYKRFLKYVAYDHAIVTVNDAIADGVANSAKDFSNMLYVLQKKGLVTWYSFYEDERTYEINLTDKGYDVIDEMESQELEEDLLNNKPSQELDQPKENQDNSLDNIEVAINGKTVIRMPDDKAFEMLDLLKKALDIFHSSIIRK